MQRPVRVIAGLLPVLLALLWGPLLHAEEGNGFPQRPMRIIVAGSVGSADDFFARTLADDLERYYRQFYKLYNQPSPSVPLVKQW